MSVMEAGDDKVKAEIADRALAARICAYIIYEGDGLGSYADKVWPFWGRMIGQACPGDENVLNAKDASAAKAQWDNATEEERKELFISWWYLIKSDAHQAVSRSIVEKIYVAYKMVRRYQQMENPLCKEKDMFDASRPGDIQAAITGFFRRSAVGIGEAGAYSANELDMPAHRFADMLCDCQAQLAAKLTGCDNKLTPFGAQIFTVLDLVNRRNTIVDTIVARQEDDEMTKQENRKYGLAERVSKRGRARIN